MTGCTIFEDTIDEALTVIHEDFANLLGECRCPEDVCLLIREELRQKKIDFIKIVALALIGEVLSVK